MIDIVLVLVIAFLIGHNLYEAHENRKQVKDLMKAVIAKNAVELRDLEAVEKIQIKASVPLEGESDLKPLENLTDEEFDQHIKEAIDNA